MSEMTTLETRAEAGETVDKRKRYSQIIECLLTSSKNNNGESMAFLKGVHLRDDVRKFVDIPINEQMAWELVHEFLNGGK